MLPSPRRVMRAAATMLLLALGLPDLAGCNQLHHKRRFLIVAAPRLSMISYLEVMKGGGVSSPQATPKPLIKTDLGTPQGIAVDQVRNRLLVADPALKKILGFTLESTDSELKASNMVVVGKDVEPRWVAVDVRGDVYLTDELANRILRIPYANSLRGNAVPEVIYDGTSLTQVNSPGGIATDNFNLYWTNKLQGKTEGALVVAANANSKEAANARVLSKTSDKAYGVCVAINNVFYTAPEKQIFGVKEKGGLITELTGSMLQPRGCIYDGDSTVYVADRGANAVFSFAGNMGDELTPIELTQEATVDDAFGLAIYAGSSAQSAQPLMVVILAIAALVW